jgi:hypothetical protein
MVSPFYDLYTEMAANAAKSAPKKPQRKKA